MTVLPRQWRRMGPLCQLFLPSFLPSNNITPRRVRNVVPAPRHRRRRLLSENEEGWRHGEGARIKFCLVTAMATTQEDERLFATSNIVKKTTPARRTRSKSLVPSFSNAHQLITRIRSQLYF